MPGRNERQMAAAAASIQSMATASVIELTSRIVQASVEGMGNAPPAPIDTNELRASTRISLGSRTREVSSPPYQDMSEADVRRIFQSLGFSFGMKVVLSWIALHANIIDGGRRLDRNGRMIGSLQAPDGFVEQDIGAGLESLRSWRYRGGLAGGSRR